MSTSWIIVSRRFLPLTHRGNDRHHRSDEIPMERWSEKKKKEAGWSLTDADERSRPMPL